MSAVDTLITELPEVRRPGCVPITADEFAAAMVRCGPFESEPRLAVAVSGGRDSMALALLAAEWATLRDGEVIAVTVDHGLRHGSADEAAQVSDWLAHHGIAHHTLTWTESPGPGPSGMGASEAQARGARYAMLERFCHACGILHLLVGHHRSDQSETQALRRERSSGVIGLAGMPAVRELRHARILRPLLDVPRERIAETLVARGQRWIEDPSNLDARFARARLRADGVDAVDAEAGHVRRQLERDLARIAARAVVLHPAGVARLDLIAFRTARVDARRGLLVNLLTCLGGSIYPPRGARLARLADAVADGLNAGGRTLGGCTIQPGARGCVVIGRELAGIASPREVLRGSEDVADWDGRFQVSGLRAGDVLGATGQFRALGMLEHPAAGPIEAVPHAVRMVMPAVRRDGCYLPCALRSTGNPNDHAPVARFSADFPLAGAIFGTI